MTIETFTVADFEKVLADAGLQFDNLNWIDGEKTYHVVLDAQSGIRVRSSIQHDGQSAGVGEDSIRCYLLGPDAKPLVAKAVTGQERWIARTLDWQTRLLATIEKLRVFRQALGNCAKCGAPRMALISRTAKNPGRVFTKCSRKECGEWGAWLNVERIAQQESMFAPTTKIASTVAQTQALEKFSATPQVAEKPVADNGLAFLTDVAELPEEPAPVMSIPQKEFSPSKYQQAAYDWIETGNGHGMMIAVPGSGKTTTLKTGTKYIPTSAKAVYMAFAVRDVEDARKRFPSHVSAKTTHSQALANAKKVYPRAVVDDTGRKLWDIQKDLYSYDNVHAFGATVKKLIGLCENRLLNPTTENLVTLCDRYNIETNGDSAKIFDMTATTFEKNLADMSLLGFDDMLYLSAKGLVLCEQFDFILLDESQDQNPAQIDMLLKSIRFGGRILAVGDPNQSCYGFRGADTDAMDNLRKALQPTELPLSICYRCPKTSIRLAQTLVPQMEWREDAPEGILDYLDLYDWSGRGQPRLKVAELLKHVQPGDLLVCRTNAPLVRPCYDLIGRGVKAAIRGRDIGKGLWDLTEKVAKRIYSSNLQMVLYELSDFVNSEYTKLMAQNKDSRAQDLLDKLETIMALSDGCKVLSGDPEYGLKERIEKVFSDKQAAITFSSIHRAKGDEADRVFILRPDLLPHPMAKQNWELQQERNLQVIAWTRNKQELHFVQ